MDKNRREKEDFAHARASFLRLWASALRPNSIFAPVRPFSLSLLNLPHSLICPNTASGSPVRPQLVVGIVVEGLEQDYIDLLRESFGQGGFNRLLKNGVVIPALDYGTPLDAHGATAVLMSGATADISGIDGASRFDREALRTVPLLHDPAAMGNYTNETYSPAALAVSTIADEARIAGGGVTAVYAIAADPQQALLLGGHSANSALWLNADNGNWATSTFYKEPPTSLASRNRLRPLAVRLDTMSWTPFRDRKSVV